MNFSSSREPGGGAANDLGDVVGDAVSFQLPLAVAFRAAAEETSRSTIRVQYEEIANRLDRGESMSTALEAVGHTIPRILTQILRSSPENARSGFARLRMQQRRSMDRRRRLRADLLSPAILIAATFLVMLSVIILIVPQFTEVLDGFGTQTPEFTKFFVDISLFFHQHWAGLVALSITMIFLFLGTIWLSRRSAAIRNVIYHIPWIGEAIRNSAESDFCEYLSLLIDIQVPLDQALPLAAETTKDVALIESADQFANLLRNGTSADVAARQLGALPVALAHCFRYGSNPASLATVLQARSSLMNSTAESQAAVIPLLVKPIALTIAVLFVGATVVALFAPLINLLNALS